MIPLAGAEAAFLEKSYQMPIQPRVVPFIARCPQHNRVTEVRRLVEALQDADFMIAGRRIGVRENGEGNAGHGCGGFLVMSMGLPGGRCLPPATGKSKA